MLKLRNMEAAELGLNSYEYKVWIALLSRGKSTAGELSNMSNVPRSRSYDVLESLKKKKFILTEHGKPIKYIAISPAEVIKLVKKNISKEAKHEMIKIADLKGTPFFNEVERLYLSGAASAASNTFCSLRGRNNIYNHLSVLIKNARNSVLIITTAKGLITKLRLLGSAFREAGKKGVKIRIAAPLTPEADNIVKESKSFIEVKDIGARARFCVVDRKEILFMVSDEGVHPAYDVGIWVKTPLAREIGEKFLNLWGKTEHQTNI